MKDIIGFIAGSANTGYFGLPVALILFNAQAFSLAIILGLGYILFENSTGVYLIARGQFGIKESIFKLLKIPSIYGFILGLTVHALNIQLPETVTSNLELFKGAYVVFGMMLLGLGLSEAKISSFDKKLIATVFFAKFIFWPAVMICLLLIDTNYLHIFNSDTHKMMMLFSILPMAANNVAWATKFKIHPEKVAVTVLLSTIFALFYLPLIVSFFF